ncbi:MAG TPA: DciA family protein [Phycisphaerae bacterium]|nr:DciA family protein [Phycisphaerae bacterium]HPS52171.1 DciA family protein [Phycisphaerae bacterium]
MTLLAAPLTMLMKHQIGRRVKKLSELSVIWDELLPDIIREHTVLDDFNNGTLKVVVDSPAVRFELQTILRSGIERELKTRFGGALNKIKIVPGQFYTLDRETGQPRYSF